MTRWTDTLPEVGAQADPRGHGDPLGRFDPAGVHGYRAKSGGPLRATRGEAMADVCARRTGAG